MRHIYGALLGLMLLAAPAAASDGKQLAAQAVDAARTLKQQAVRAAAAGERLELKRGPASELFGRIFDIKGFDDLPPMSASDMEWIVDWLGAVRDANYAMLYFGANLKTPLTLTPAAMERNVKQYEDELATATVFQQKMFPRMLETGVAFLESLSEKERTPIRQEGFEKALNGYVESVTGALCFAAAADTKPENARAIMAVLHETAEIWATLSSPEARKNLSQMATAARKTVKDKEAAEHLLAIQAALDATKS